jgi:uncharacterized protein (DUF1800 family)
MNIKEILHISRRAGFGLNFKDVLAYEQMSKSEAIDKLFSDSKFYSPIYFKDIVGIEDMKKQDTKEEKKKEKQQSRQDEKELNILWIDKMVNDKAQLTEKMTLFWHGHFASRSPIAEFTLNQNNLFRKHALGSFRELVQLVAKDPSMLQFLNNQQNQKQHPNENFARELMELFTLGRGNYTENDVKEAARAFTGWGFDKQGDFIIRKNAHDTDSKTFRGKKGNFNGNDIIDMILDDRKCAEYITKKIYRFFVNEETDNEKVRELTDVFYKSDYDILKLMHSIFSADWFWDDKNCGIKIKSPVEFIVELMKILNLKFYTPDVTLTLEKSLNQVLFNPPNVAGWPGGNSWIDTSTLLFRLKLSELIFKGSELEFSYKNSDNVAEMGSKKNYNNSALSKNLKSDIDIKPLKESLTDKDYDEIFETLTEFLIPVDIKDKHNLIRNYCDESNREDFIESTLYQLISLPEFQLS